MPSGTLKKILPKSNNDTLYLIAAFALGMFFSHMFLQSKQKLIEGSFFNSFSDSSYTSSSSSSSSSSASTSYSDSNLTTKVTRQPIHTHKTVINCHRHTNDPQMECETTVKNCIDEVCETTTTPPTIY